MLLLLLLFAIFNRNGSECETAIPTNLCLTALHSSLDTQLEIWILPYRLQRTTSSSYLRNLPSGSLFSHMTKENVLMIV